MHLETEKKALIKQIEQVNDIRLLPAVKSVLDYGLKRDVGLEASLERAMEPSDKGEGRPHNQFMKSLKLKYYI